MNKSLHNLRSASIVAIAAWLAVLAQVAMVTHSVLEEHSLGEHCEVCVAQDRADDYLAAPEVTTSGQFVHVIGDPEVRRYFVAAVVAGVRNRGPPNLSAVSTV